MNRENFKVISYDLILNNPNYLGRIHIRYKGHNIIIRSDGGISSNYLGQTYCLYSGYIDDNVISLQDHTKAGELFMKLSRMALPEITAREAAKREKEKSDGWDTFREGAYLAHEKERQDAMASIFSELGIN